MGTGGAISDNLIERFFSIPFFWPRGFKLSFDIVCCVEYNCTQKGVHYVGEPIYCKVKNQAGFTSSVLHQSLKKILSKRTPENVRLLCWQHTERTLEISKR